MSTEDIWFEPRKLTGYSEEDLLDEIRRVVEAFGGVVPNSVEFRRSSRVGLSTIRRSFGTYEKALEKAGFSYKKRVSVSRRKYSQEEVMSNLREVVARSGGYEFSLDFYRKNGGLFKSRTPIKEILGLNWEAALAAAGARKRENVVHVSEHSQRLNFLAELTKDDLLNEIDHAWKELGRCPTRNEFGRISKKFTASIYQYRFGSWSKAIEALCNRGGIPIPRIPGTPLSKVVSAGAGEQGESSRRVAVSREDLLSDLNSAKKKAIENPFTYKAYAANGGVYHIDTFRTRFGSWAEAVEAVGGVSGGRGSTKITNEKLFDEIQTVWERLGRQPTFDEMRSLGRIHPKTYHTRYGSWMKAIHAFCEDRNNPTNEDSLLEEHPASEPEATVIEAAKENLMRVSAEKTSLVVIRKTGRAVPKRLRFRVFERDSFTCKACGRSPGRHGVALEADHVVPYSKGGETVIENLQTLCEDCNRGKSNVWSI